MFFFHSLKTLWKPTHTHGREKSYFFDNNEPLNPEFIFSIVSISLLVEKSLSLCPPYFPLAIIIIIIVFLCILLVCFFLRKEAAALLEDETEIPGEIELKKTKYFF